jgi:ribosomal protein S18 acetylase RimI-like enzyme
MNGMHREHPLDNPIWSALTSCQVHFAEIGNLARKFPLEVTPLGGFAEPSEQGFASLAVLQTAREATGVFLADRFPLPDGWTIVDQAPLLQMVQKSLSGRAPSAPPEFSELTLEDVPEMVALARLTKPGPFGLRTRELGTYIGICREGRLAAMAGERLRVHGFTEISAVCTHPDFTGRGFAACLMVSLAEKIHSRGEIPFLHVRETNRRAIDLYRRLGFADRTVLQYVAARKPDGKN